MRALGTEQSVPVLDMFSLVNGLPAAEKAAWAEDGLHPGPQGQVMVFQVLRSALESMVQFDNLRCAAAAAVPFGYVSLSCSQHATAMWIAAAACPEHQLKMIHMQLALLSMDYCHYSNTHWQHNASTTGRLFVYVACTACKLLCGATGL